MYKFTEDGKGPMHLRFFTVLIDKQKVEEDSCGSMCYCMAIISCVGPSQLRSLIKISNQVNLLRCDDTCYSYIDLLNRFHR